MAHKLLFSTQYPQFSRLDQTLGDSLTFTTNFIQLDRGEFWVPLFLNLMISVTLQKQYLLYLALILAGIIQIYLKNSQYEFFLWVYCSFHLLTFSYFSNSRSMCLIAFLVFYFGLNGKGSKNANGTWYHGLSSPFWLV